MKTEVKKIDSVTHELKVEIPKDRVASAMSEVYADMSKVANVKGFRKGKVPRNVLEAQHGKAAEEETVRKLVPIAYNEGIEKEKLSPIDMPEIQDINFKDGIITFTAKFDIKPEVKIKDYKGISVKRKSSEVTDEDINKTFEMIKQGQGKDKDVKIDDEFAKGIGYPSLEEFKKSLRRQMEMDKDRQNKADVENQIIEALLKKTKLDTPPSLIKKQMERRLQDNRQQMKQHGMSEEDIAKKEKEGSKDLAVTVEKDVKVYLTLDKIAELEKIDVKEGENLPAKVIEFLLKEAKWEGEK